MSKVTGIYCIENNITGKKYYGQSVDVYKRLYNHKYMLRHSKHPNEHLQSSWTEYGESSFDFYVVSTCDVADLDKSEEFYINKHETLNPRYGYNMTSGGKSSREFRQDTIKKMSDSHKGIKLSPVTRKRMSESKKGIFVGREISKETREKLSKALTGRRVPTDIIEKIRIGLINRNKKSNSTSKYRGVCFNKGAWDSRIKYKGQLFILGRYKNEDDAARAYNEFVKEKGFPHPLNLIK